MVMPRKLTCKFLGYSNHHSFHFSILRDSFLQILAEATSDFVKPNQIKHIMSQNTAGEKTPQVDYNQGLKRAAMENDTNGLEQKLAPYLPLCYEFLSMLLFTALHYHSYDFVVEILRLKPELVWAKNTDGHIVMHISCEHGLFLIVTELLKLNRNLCLVRDDQGRSPIHIAAANGRLEVLQALVTVCPDSLLELTSSNETALHVAAKNGQVESFQFLMQQCLVHNHSRQLNRRDDEGQNVFNIAASTDQKQILQMLSLHIASRTHFLCSQRAEQQQVPKSADSMIVEQTILAFMAGVAFTALSNYSNMFQPEHQARTVTFHFKDIISAPNRLPLGFYYVVLITEVFIVSMVSITKSISSPCSSWSVCYVEVLLLLVVFLFLAFLVMVNLFVPHFVVRIIFSLAISSFWFVLLLDVAFVLVLVPGVFMVKKCSGVFPRRKRPFIAEKKGSEESTFTKENILDEGQGDKNTTTGDTVCDIA